MASLDEVFARFDEAETLIEAEQALDALTDEPLPDHLLGDAYNELADAAADDDEHEAAVRLQRKALDAGCRDRELGRQMLAWHLLKAGAIDEGEQLLAELRNERPDSADLAFLVGNARFDAGFAEAALAAFDEALQLAKAGNDLQLLDMIRTERRQARLETGLQPDADDHLAPRAGLPEVEQFQIALAWFPPNQRASATTRWPGLADDFADSVHYANRLERLLRGYRRDSGRNPGIAPLDVAELVAWAKERGHDPDSGEARALFAAELQRTGRAIAWPPGRNDPCWCESGRKYKRCCGAL